MKFTVINLTICLVVLFVGTCYTQNCGIKPEQPPWEPGEKMDKSLVEDGDLYIVDGRDVVGAGYWPWQLSLQYLSNGTVDDFQHNCGAIFIDPRWALTAAHCVDENVIGGPDDPGREDPANFRLIFGGHNISHITNEQILSIDLIIKHERWQPDIIQGFPNDIALLRLTTEPDLEDERIGMACLPQQTDLNFTGNPNCWMTGWGKVQSSDPGIPAILQEALTEVPPNDWCAAIHIGYVRDTHICAGAGLPNICSYDSGGPMSCLVDTVWYAAGIASWVTTTCDALPGVFTRISKYWEWIEFQKLSNAPTTH